MGLHEHGVVLFESVDSANEGNWTSHEIQNLLDTDVGMGLSVHLFYFFLHVF